MAVLVVTNTNDSGAGSLRDAVTQANADAASADQIVFAKSLAGQTIIIDGPLILTNVSINGDTNGDGDADITISGGGMDYLVDVGSGTTAALTSLVLTGGYNKRVETIGYQGMVYTITTYFAASTIRNAGNLTITGCVIGQNFCSGEGTIGYTPGYNYGPPPGAASRSAVFNSGTLTIEQSVLLDNSTFGIIEGGAGSIVNTGILILAATAFSGNNSTAGGGASPYYSYGSAPIAGGNGGPAGGCVLNYGVISGTYMNQGSLGIGGYGGYGLNGGADGAPGPSSDGVLTLTGGSGSLTTVNLGTMGADTKVLAASSSFFGLGGRDNISVLGGSYVDGGAGSDRIKVDSGVSGSGFLPSVVRGGLGNDKVVAVYTIFGGSYDGGGGRDTIDFSLDTFSGQRLDLSQSSFSFYSATFSNFENITGSQGSDIITGSRTGNTLKGFSGDDLIEGRAGKDRLDGGQGTDTLSYERSSAGVTVSLAKGTAVGGDATGDVIAKFENVTGSRFVDALTGNADGNVLSGGAGVDFLYGLDGDDRLIGGAGLDQLSGGAGADTFVLTRDAASADAISNFRPVDDTLEISAALFGGGLMAGSLTVTNFVTNTTGRAGDPDDRFVFNSNTGELFFDSNGNATGGRSLIATFTGNIPVLTASDILIV